MRVCRVSASYVSTMLPRLFGESRRVRDNPPQFARMNRRHISLDGRRLEHPIGSRIGRTLDGGTINPDIHGGDVAHDVRFNTPSRNLERADVTFNVKSNGAKLGTLTVSRGSVVWFQKDRQWGFKMGWRDFDRFMAGQGTRWEKR